MSVMLPTAIRRYRKLVFFTWFLTLDLIMFGTFVRLTDSGLGCPDWPGCYRQITPLQAMGNIDQAHAQMPFGPVSVSKAWIEMVHRYVGSLIGLLIIVMLFMAWRYRRQIGHSPLLAVIILGEVCLQGAFGAWTVTMKLMPVVVSTHLLLGMLLLALMTWIAAREKPHAPVSEAAARWRVPMMFGLVLLAIQIALGGWVSTNYAALACMEFPTCQGQWIPPMNFHEGFSLFRQLGETASGQIISQYALTAIHWTHRNFAFIVLIYLGTLAWKMRADAGLRGPATLILGLLCLQLFTGLTTIFFQWPLLVSVVHSGGAAGLVLGSVTAMVRLGRAGVAYAPRAELVQAS